MVLLKFEHFFKPQIFMLINRTMHDCLFSSPRSRRTIIKQFLNGPLTGQAQMTIEKYAYTQNASGNM